jgi:adenosylcobinamide-GDP ribazoletransferase
MAATVLATGAFHEDGFADTCDGFGGGWDKAQILAIMKDSRLGSYGAIGMTLMLLAKWNALMDVDPAYLLPALLAGHAASRFAATTLIFSLDYAREDASAKAKPLTAAMGTSGLLVAAVFGLAPSALLPLPELACALGAAALATFLMARYFVRRIGGYTGDCLGATQQVAELAFYVGLLCDFS